MKKSLPLLALCALLTAPNSFGQALTEVNQGLKELFPEGLVNAEGEKVELDTLNDKVVGVYFSAHWCGPCRKFTPGLVEYRNKNKDKFEVIFVSSDRTKEAKEKYMEENKMEWPSVPWRSANSNTLSQKYGVRGIPYLVLLNDEGQTLTKDGRSLISSNVDIDKLHSARVVNEQYKCGNCDKVHVRQKVVYGDEATASAN